MSATDDASASAPTTLTLLRKADGAITKRIRLDKKGNIVADGSECRMAAGEARRVKLDGIAGLAELIKKLQSNEAISLGALRTGLSDRVEITTKHKLRKLNGVPRPDLIARTRDSINYVPDQPAFLLLDNDPKGMPPEMAQRVEANGGFGPTMEQVFPELKSTPRLERLSTSAGLSNSKTGQRYPASGGQHTYIRIRNGADAVRFLHVMHDRLWSAGYGYFTIGKAGQPLERSLIDKSVGAPERIVFEAPPILEPPLVQDAELRAPRVYEGEGGAADGGGGAGDAGLDTIELFPSLTLVEQTHCKKLKAQAWELLQAEAAEARRVFLETQVDRLVKRTGMATKRAWQVATRWCEGILHPSVELPFDDPALAGKTVGDVMADPEAYEGETLSDPIEGEEYGVCKAMVMLRDDGTPFIHSFAHGRIFYRLRYDYEAVKETLEAAAQADVVGVFVKHMLNADVSADEHQALLNLAAQRSKIGKRAIAATLKAALGEQEAKRRAAAQEHKLATRTDPRPQLPMPFPIDEYLPVMDTLNEVLGASTEAEPPMRNVMGELVRVHNRRVPHMHELTAQSVNVEGEQDPEAERIPAPEQPLLDPLDAGRVAELIERYIEFVDERSGRSVHLPGNFVEHYVRRDDAALPQVHHVITLPIMLPNGTLLTGRGLNRRYNAVFRVPAELEAWLPKLTECNEQAVADAMDFLTNEWLVDVATSYTGKGIIISAALALIERTLLGERPVYGITAGRRGGGKTTLMTMLFVAVTGLRVPAAAWSKEEEERRKALFSYLLTGVPAIAWDNIPRGLQINCPRIEASCTSALSSDRKLGVSEIVEATTSAIHFFTGNNIGFKGDLSSRGLLMFLEVDRPDPENRAFEHPDPIGWTLDHRGKILRSLFTLLLGNPHRDSVEADTRFKDWWRLCGSAVEHGARQHCNMSFLYEGLPRPQPISFRQEFLFQEDEEEEGASLGEMLSALDDQWPKGEVFKAVDVAKLINGESRIKHPEAPVTEEKQARYDADSATEKRCSEALSELLFPDHRGRKQEVSAPLVGKRLRNHLRNPVRFNGRTLTLIGNPDTHTKEISYYVRVS
jgi:hypothetical protein